jgi:hypothetical protein
MVWMLAMHAGLLKEVIWHAMMMLSITVVSALHFG